MQMRPGIILAVTLIMTLSAMTIVLYDNHQMNQIQSDFPAFTEMDPNQLYSDEVVSGFENGSQAVIVICQTATEGETISAGPSTLYLKAANGSRSAAYFPQTTSSRQLWTYAAFDDTSLQQAIDCEMEYGSQPVSYTITDETQQFWDIKYETEGRTIRGSFPTDAIVSYRTFNLLFYQGEQVVFADTLDQVKLGSPMTFVYEMPFELPPFDRIQARAL